MKLAPRVWLSTTMLVATLPGVAEAGRYRRVVCPDGEPVFVPNSCSREFKRTAREFDLKLTTAGTTPAAEVSAGSHVVPLAERLDQLNLELQTHYISSCMAFARTPCDGQMRAAHLESAQRLPELYGELRGLAMTESDESLREAVEQQLARLGGRDEPEGPAALTGSWVATSTPRGGTCPAEVRHSVRSAWQVSAAADGTVVVHIDSLQGEEATAYPRFDGSLSGDQLALSGRSAWGEGTTRLQLQVEKDRIEGLRTVEGPGCIVEYSILAVR